MANNSPTIVAASLSDDQLKKSIDSLVSHVDEAMKKMVQSTNNAVGEMEAKLKSLGNVRINSGGANDGGSSRRTSSVEKETKARKELVMTLDQQAAALDKASGKKKGVEYMSLPSDVDKNLTYLVNVNKDVDAQMDAILKKEQALIDAKQKEAQVSEQIASAQRAANSVRGVSAYDLGINPNVSAGRQRQIESTRAASKETEYLKQQVASLLEVEEREIKTANTTSSSYAQLAQYLKNLQSAYQRLGADRIAKGEGTDLANEIQRTQRAMQKLQQTMSRPVSLKDALGGSEKTLDDIAYKMQRLRAYKQGIDLTKPNAANEIKQVDEALAKLQKDADKWMSKSNEMIKSNTALGRSWNYMKNRLAFYFTVGTSTQFVKNLIEIRSQYEMNERALGILIDSAERGTRIFNELSQMALVSPYTLIELSTAAKQLTAYDVAAKDVVDTTRRLADMASAVGIPIERLTYALGQIKAYGYLNARDARMFSNAGIPLVKQLAEHYTELEGKMVSTADVYDRIKKKAIDMTDVMQVINKMTDEGGKFFDFQAKMAGTLKVQLANLTLAWNNMLNDIGASEQGTISTGIGLLKELFLQWKNISKMVTNLAIGFGVVKAAQLAYYGVVMGTNKAIALETVLGNRLSNSLRSLASSTNAARMSSTALWVGIATFAAAAVVDILRGNEAMKEFNKTLRENAENTYNDLKKFSENYSGLRESLYKTENGKQTPVDINSEEAKKAWEVLREQIELSSHASEEYISKLLSIENVSERLRQGFAVIDSIQAVSAAIKEIGDSAIKLERDWSAWWNLGLLPDGTIGNLQDAYMWLSKIEEKYGSVVNARKVASTSRTDEGFKNVFQDEAKEFVENYETELEKFRKDIQVTKQSIIDFIELKGWSGDTSKINEVFKTFTDNLILKNQLNPQQAYTLQLEMEEARSKAAKEALLQRINDERAALKISHDDSVREALAADIERYKNWDETNGRSKVEWERFTKWLKEQHISETTAMFRNMDAEDIRSLNFQEGKHAEWVKRMVTQYAKEHKMSYDDAFGYLKSWVTSANQWSIRIPVMLDIQNLSWLQEDFKNRLPESTLDVSQYKTLSSAISDWQKKRKEGLEEIQRLEKAGIYLTTGGTEADRKHYAEVQKEVSDTTAALKAYKAELTKGSGGKKKDPLLDALKQEISLVEKLQSDYDKLSKSGASQAEALETIRGAYGKTIRLLNAQLGKYGLPQLDISQLITGKDPNKTLAHFKQTLDTLVNKGMLTLERSKELEAVVEKFTLSAKTYNLDMITKGLNNELGKLKDEYELAVELDANPELGNMFTQLLGIDTSTMSHSIDEYMDTVRMAADKARMGLGYGIGIDIFGASEDEWQRWAEWVGISNEKMQEFRAMFEPARSVVKKWATDTVNNTKKLEYELAELNEKIAIKEKEQAQLHEKIEKEKNEVTKYYLQLTYQSNEKAIDELRAQALSLMPEYARVFNSIAEYSAGVSRRLQRDLMRVFDEAKYDSASGKWTLTGSDGKQTILNDTQYRKEREKLTKEMRKSQAPFKKIKEAFKPSDKNGVVDYAKGIELISGEVQKLGSVASEVGNLAQIFGADEQTVEIINDVATSLNGVATAGQGISQIASGDYIAGAASVLSGITSVIGAWADNSNKRIDAEIKDSELAVKRLELAYIDLEQAVDRAMGTAVIGAKQATIANKELQLAEIKRQIQLEKSRKSKDRDEDKIVDLQKQYKELYYEIKNGYTEIVDDLMGTDASSFAENLVSSMIDAFKQGEDYMKVFNEKFDEMIDNMIMKSIVSRVVSSYLNKIWDSVDQRIRERSEKESKDYANRQNINEQTKELSDEEIRKAIAASRTNGRTVGIREWTELLNSVTQKDIEDYRRAAEAEEKAAKERFDAATEFTDSDIDYVLSQITGVMPELGEKLKNILSEYYKFGENSDKNLSSLQQGIQGITEDTAGALESYMNGVSQQVYLHSDLLTQIRDAVVGIDIDVQVATQAQMLLQLQQSYAVQMTIQGILEGWNNPSGQAVRVELVS